MSRTEFDLLCAITNQKLLAQINGKAIFPEYLIPGVPAIVVPLSDGYRSQVLSAYEVNPADIWLLPVRTDFQTYMRTISFNG